MAPSAASYLRGACLLDTVEAMASTLATDGVVMVQEPSVDLTNGILLDLYRFVDRSEHRKIVGVQSLLAGLLHGLGYIPTLDRAAAKKWDLAGKRMHDVFVKRNKSKYDGVCKADYLARRREDCMKPGAVCEAVISGSSPSIPNQVLLISNVLSHLSSLQ